ncbi:MAG: MmcQ/YjbR family DNA-binding protein [Sphingobacteriales bacterium]|nr:MmcQ/YjbR family DNA-binding protein [Sphingobacteriales bacterium]
MVDINTFKEVALSFPNTEAKPHFDRTAFKVIGRKIFATLHEESETANLVLSPIDQSVFCSFGKTAIYPVPNKFGLQGWTTIELNKVPIELLNDALLTAYNSVMETKPKKKKEI